MKQGFVTIATGDERYYQMARNLLRSYRQTCKKPMRFALIADRHNEYTAEFDDVVILEHPAHSWMDKLQLLRSCPYEENIFIDADCLVYQDINFLWDLFEEADDFSCFGSALPMDAKDGWFTRDVEKLYPIHFITHLHGMLYFIRRGKSVDEMDQLCQKIISDYHSVSFKAFNDVLADEPVFALAMAIMDMKPIVRKPEYYCFVPFATRLVTDYRKRQVTYTNPKDGEVDGCCIVHWGNKNTLKAQYKADSHKLNYCYPGCTAAKNRAASFFLHQLNIIYWVYTFEDCGKAISDWLQWFFERLRFKITRIVGK